MSKLARLKQWLSLEDAARYLQAAFGENVTETDVIRLALDHRLRLSVVFPQFRPFGAPCEHVDPSGVDFEEVPTLDGDGTLRLPKGGPVYVTERDTPVGRSFQVKSEVAELREDYPYDLLLIGGDRIELSHQYWQSTDVLTGPPRFVTLDGIFLADGPAVYQLRLEGRRQSGFFFYPPSSLPGAAQVVVRPSALLALEAPENGSTAQAEKPLTGKERGGLLNIIGALVELIQTPKGGRDSDASVIRELIDNYGDKNGLSKRNLEEKFADAKRSLRE